MTQLDLQVSASADDAEEHQNSTSFNSTGVNVSAATAGTAANRISCGLRFRNVTIPQGTTITRAWLEVWCVKADDPNCNIVGEAADNAVDFATTLHVFSRTKTAASVTWNAANVGLGLFVSSPDITTVVQEILNRAGWVSGNAMVIILDGRNTTATSITVDSFDDTTPSQAAKLHITYGAAATVLPDREQPRGVGRGILRGVA